MDSIFTCGPVIEHLIIEGDLGVEQHLTFNITAPELQRLEMAFFDDRPDYNQPPSSNFRFNINAPKLEKFEVKDNYMGIYSLMSTNSLREAKISFTELHAATARKYVPTAARRIQRLFSGLLDVKSLSLDAQILGERALANRCNLPTLEKLKRLELYLGDDCPRQLLTILLTISPNLENLVLEIVLYNFPQVFHIIGKCFTLMELINYLWVETSCLLNQKQRGWSAPNLVPQCLVSSLKTVCGGFKRKSADRKVIKFLLKNSKILDKFTFYAWDLSAPDMSKVRRQILMSAKGSETCQVGYPKFNIYKWLMEGVLVDEI